MSWKERLQKKRVKRAKSKIEVVSKYDKPIFRDEYCFRTGEQSGYEGTCVYMSDDVTCKKTDCTRYADYLEYKKQAAKLNEIQNKKNSGKFAYIIKTPIKQIRADVDEYKKLEQSLKHAFDKYELAYANIQSITYEDYDGIFARPDACVRIIHDDGYDESVGVQKQICKKFESGEHCAAQNCDCVKYNHEYFDAKKDYEEQKKAYALFWENKFANVKQK